MHELFEHTADLGIRAISPTLADLFRDMALGLTESMIDNPEAIEPVTAYPIELTGSDREYLLFDWLRALLMLFETDQVLVNKFDISMTTGGLVAVAWGEPCDRLRHHLSREVKAITYHDLKVEATPEGWLAEVIVDI
jgi:SHS2 domain-containing protein